MRIKIGLLILPLLLLCDRSAAGSFDHGSLGAESEPRSEVIDHIRLREEKPNQNSHRDSSADNWTSNSSRADSSCPDEAAIAPCVCTVNGNYTIYLDCTFVESEEQLATVFQQEFPVKELHEFSMDSNSAIRVLGNILNGVTFERIVLSPGPFVLEQVTESFISDSKDSLTSIEIDNSNLTSDQFPFQVFSQMENLESFSIYTSSLTEIPPILAPKLFYLRLAYGLTDTIQAETFSIHEWDSDFRLYGNQIVTVEPGSFFFSDENSAGSSGALTISLDNNQIQSLQAETFPIRNAHVDLDLYNNQIASIEPGTFILPEATGVVSSAELTISLYSNQLQSLQAETFPLLNAVVFLYLYDNQIASIEPGTFVLPEATDSLSLLLDLHYNQLTTVDEAVFGDLMPFVTELRLYGNPLSCECDIAWLVLNSDVLLKIDADATCADGTNLHDLDPQYYEDSC